MVDWESWRWNWPHLIQICPWFSSSTFRVLISFSSAPRVSRGLQSENRPQRSSSHVLPAEVRDGRPSASLSPSIYSTHCRWLGQCRTLPAAALGRWLNEGLVQLPAFSLEHRVEGFNDGLSAEAPANDSTGVKTLQANNSWQAAWGRRGIVNGGSVLSLCRKDHTFVGLSLFPTLRRRPRRCTWPMTCPFGVFTLLEFTEFAVMRGFWLWLRELLQVWGARRRHPVVQHQHRPRRGRPVHLRRVHRHDAGGRCFALAAHLVHRECLSWYVSVEICIGSTKETMICCGVWCQETRSNETTNVWLTEEGHWLPWRQYGDVPVGQIIRTASHWKLKQMLA